MQKEMITRIGKSCPHIQFSPGDKVKVDFGVSGSVGPGEISARIEFSDGWIGYLVDIPVTDAGDSFVIGWVGSELLRPAASGLLEPF